MLENLAGTTAVVRAAIAPLAAEPRVAAPQISQRLAGHSVQVLETSGEWLHVRGDDEYTGWMHRGYLALGSNGELTERPGRRTSLSLGCVVNGHDGRQRALPLGAFLAPGEEVVSGTAIPRQEIDTCFERTPGALIRTALDLFAGTPYQWGGVTPWGADCSGLVQTVFWLHGIQIPRDAAQQSTIGVEAGADPLASLPADLLFFSDRADDRVTHVAIALGAMRLVHLALGRGGYSVERLDDDRDSYVAALRRAFRFARRLVG